MQEGRVRTGAKDIILPAGQVSWVKCRVPSNMDASTRLVLFEADEDNLSTEQWDTGPAQKKDVAWIAALYTSSADVMPQPHPLLPELSLEELAKAQRDDPGIGEMIKLKETNEALTDEVRRQNQPRQRASSPANDEIPDTDDEDEGTGGYWLRTPVVRMENDHSGRSRQTSAVEGEQRLVSQQFPPATVPVRTPKKPTVIHKEHIKTKTTFPRIGTELMDETNLPERDNTHMDETNLPEGEHEQNVPEEEGEVGDETETDEQHDVIGPPQPEEDEQNDQAEQVQVEGPSSPPLMTLPAEDELREVRRSARERRPRPRFTYESLGQPSIQTHVNSISQQMTSVSLPFMPHIARQFIVPAPYTPQMYMPYTYYMPVTTQVY
ncbi:hypothetical protein GBF38_016528 [Nibea albiflora]|uniref:Uncharacterized protein n=1 Tax=Nibea albiflora TaxID=240163 RepID=A0ACB7FJ34_NIBAL|nr:hypothetical protein GBF38_016528 [Nibea albiflora]